MAKVNPRMRACAYAGALVPVWRMAPHLSASKVALSMLVRRGVAGRPLGGSMALGRPAAAPEAAGLGTAAAAGAPGPRDEGVPGSATITGTQSWH